MTEQRNRKRVGKSGGNSQRKRRRDYIPTTVPFSATPRGETPSIDEWAHPAVWTDRMLTTLLEGAVRGGKRHSLNDKVHSKLNLYWSAGKVLDRQGAPGIDGMTVDDFEDRQRMEIERLRTQLRDGSYQPASVRRTWIPKPGSTEKRPLGIPTVSDRIVQMVAKLVLEPQVEPHFHPDSYGYRPGKSALDAVGVTRQRCWRQDWVIDLDIKGFFDNLDWDLVLKAVRHHTDNPWILLYVERWLKAPVQRRDGSLEERTKGSPQGTDQSLVVEPVHALRVR